VPPPAEDLRRALLAPAEAEAMEAHGTTAAAVLLPLYDYPQRPGLIFTERRADMRRHAGEISFPGGRQDFPDEPLLECALRETEEEIGLDRSMVEVVGALPPVSTMVTSYKVHPFVGLVPSRATLTPNPEEVETVLYLRLDDLVRGYGKRRLVRRRMPIKTDTYLVDDKLVWGATARILGSFVERLGLGDDFRATGQS
jgi:8-oxo-dGTP pyrophosphatase MutT (NUDIX family)